MKNIKKSISKLCYYLYHKDYLPVFLELSSAGKFSKFELLNYKYGKVFDLIKYLKSRKLNFFFNSEVDSSSFVEVFNVFDKSILKNMLHELVDSNFQISKRSTSGTTGLPFVFYKDSRSLCYMDAMMHLAYSWHGVQIGDPEARIWGRSLSFMAKSSQVLKDVLLNRARLSVFEMDNFKCHSYFRKLKSFKPKYFYAYPNALFQFAIFVENNKLNGRELQISVAICTGEVMFPHVRDKIAEVFGCTVVNEYGSTENGIIAFECEYGCMHVLPTVFVEIENKDNDGFGHILVTELNSRSIPFVRYKTGDVGRVIDKQCECKRPYEILEIRDGRIDDYVKCPDGRLVYDAIFAYALKDIAVQFRVYQDRLDLLTIFIVPNSNYSISSKNKVNKVFTQFFGDNMHIEFVVVDSIPVSSSGKYRYFISRI